ncbi:VanZ family protein [Bacillus haynesii]|uniref:VanZ family protein n=1 Tax=Bacillus haynesii TaxID=1925021 RepID=UPI0022825B01|nr:VanZ family protein [Bacillus haynesii]MCY8099116.1 VanZ family protein [Bacillus haynesii]MCY8468062.1 VanZ family protein [Bacillus haynesii]
MVIFFEGWILYSFIILYLCLIFLLKFKFNKSYTYLFFFSIMSIYFYHVINLTQFPIYIDDVQREAFREVYGEQNNVWREMNFIPFKHGFSLSSFYNIIMTIPLGFGLPFLINTSFKKVFTIGLLTSLILETCQLLTALYAGYTFRFVDIDDVILNLLGTLIGYVLIFKSFKFLFKSLLNKFDIKFNSIIKHIYNADESLNEQKITTKKA